MPIIRTSEKPLAFGNRPAWCEATSAGIFRVPRDGGRFDCHYHDCNEYWLVFAGKAKVKSEGVEHYVRAGDIVCTRAGDEHDVLEVYEDLAAFWFEDATPEGGRIGHLHRGTAGAAGHSVPAKPLPDEFAELEAMTRPLRYIQVGTGGFGALWCKSFLPRLTHAGKAVPVAAVDISADNLTNARQYLELPASKCYTDMRQAFAENEADFAIVVVPPAFHEQVVDLALEHGLHILSEKPIADSMAATCRIYKKVKAAGKRMAITMSHRFDQDKQSLLRLIQSGEHGKLDYLIGRNTWTCRSSPSWGAFRYKIPDPLLIEGTVHHFDIIRSLTGSNAKTVFAKTWNPPWSDFEGDAQALINIDMENGVKVLYEGAKCNASELNGWAHDYWRAECDRSTLELDNRKLRILRGRMQSDARIEQVPLAQQPVWMNAWLADMFCDWLRGEREDHPTELDDNLNCSALLFAAVESAHSGNPVDVQDFLQRHLRGELQ